MMNSLRNPNRKPTHPGAVLREDVQRIANVVRYSLNDLLAMQGNKPLLIDKVWDTMQASGQEAPL